MPTLSSKELQALDGICRSYRIKFVGTVEPSKWPECHRTILQDISQLSQCTLSSYAVDENVAQNSPWKIKTRGRALELVEIAKRNPQRNEATWRFSCEPYIFRRLVSEVACHNCRGRVWRSEIEVTPDTRSRGGDALRKRQRQREPCRCPRYLRREDQLEAIGLNPIFGQRQEEEVPLESPIAERLGKRYQRVDAVYGLRQTRNIENLLNDTRRRQFGQELDRDATLLHEQLQPSPLEQPLSQNGDELLYPFLVVEAKSGTADCDWYSIDMQTAPPIRTFLQAQERLYDKASIRTAQSELVWFVSHRGEDWRVSLGYIQRDLKDQEATTRPFLILEAWRGSIVSPDGALQLLLLIDYIFDWARDTYRPDIIRKLRLLASGDNDMATIPDSDTDIFSTRQLELEIGSLDTREDEQDRSYRRMLHMLCQLDTGSQAIRHASMVENRYCCLFVTRDNISLLQDATAPNDRDRARLFTAISQATDNLLLLEQSTIMAMEKSWTGQQSVWPPTFGPQSQFYTQVTCSSYLSSQWIQVRELYAIAVETDVWPYILKASSKQRDGIVPRIPPCTDSLLDNINLLQAGTMDDTLLACINRRAVTWQNRSTLEDPVCHFHQVPARSEGHTEERPAEPVASTNANGTIRDVVQYVYKTLKRGSIEPTESCIKHSKSLVVQHLLPDSIKKQKPLWPLSTTREALQVADNRCVLIQGRFNRQDSERSPASVCLYVLAVDEMVVDALRKGRLLGSEYLRPNDARRYVFETRDLYHTTFDNGISSLASLSKTSSSQVPWNISGTYGVCLNLEQRLHDLGWEPNRIGAPRLGNGALSGTHLHTRIPNPWKDPRQRTESCALEVFVFFKLMMKEFDYWGKVAQVRIICGTWACHWCAGNRVSKEHLALCRDCFEACNPGGALRWLGGFLEDRLVPFAKRGQRMRELEETCDDYDEDDDGDYDYEEEDNKDYAEEEEYEETDEESDEDEDEDDDANEPAPLDQKWYAILCQYDELKQPFRDLHELVMQSREFVVWFEQYIEGKREKIGLSNN